MKIVLKFGIDHFWSSHISEMVMSPGTPVCLGALSMYCCVYSLT
jgi:hypothetical protein